MKGRPHASFANLDMRSKYTRRDKNTSLLAGQYRSIRSRYASSEMVGTLRAWKVSDILLARAVLDAVVSVCHIGGRAASFVGEPGMLDGCVVKAEGISLPVILSLVVAICVKRDASRRRRSWESYE
jgi:hypothetical protein